MTADGKKTGELLLAAKKAMAEEAACVRLSTGFEQKLELGRRVTEPPAWAKERADIAARLQSRPGRLRLALTGGIASGKTAVAGMLEKRGAAHIDFDVLARRAVEPGSPGAAQAADLFGADFINEDGSLKRREVSRLIFSDPEKKAALENIIHPLTWELMAGELIRLAEAPQVVISVPLLFEAGLETFFSPIVMVFAAPAVQMARLTARNPELDESQAMAMIETQWPAPPKVTGSNYIINNNGSLEDTARQVEALWRELGAID
ncbi:dephospho-CoA kinase [Deltaproteobacteria bacterium OttesenSCG-928-M10]|nr:dephospho-CoA kinase [Deltaproteobacteria bacterium OttesenSCG-928-M10]